MAILKPYSYNGTSLQSTDYDTSFPRANGMTQVQTNANYVKRAGAPSILSGKDYQTPTLNLEILVLHDTFSMLESINALFDTKDETPRQLIVTDEQDSQKQYYVYATPRQVVGGHDGNQITVNLAVDDPIWRSVTEFSDTTSMTTSSDTLTIAVGGNDYAYPVFEITPTSQPTTDYLYNVYLQVLPTSTDPFPNRPLYLNPTTDVWDTAALIAAGKMQSSDDPGGNGGDIRVLRDGQFWDYQLADINTTDTKILVVSDMPGLVTCLVKDAVPSGAITEITAQLTTASIAGFNLFPPTGRLVIDSEEFTYTSKINTATKKAFVINSRSVRGTTDSTHAVGATISWLPYDFTIIYGNSTVSAYEIDEARKPIFATSDSSNSMFVYKNIFSDDAGLRAGSWKPSVIKVTNATLTNSGYYTSSDNSADVSPSVVAGIETRSYQQLGVWKADTVTIEWKLFVPDKVSSDFSASGYQARTVAAAPSHFFGLKKSGTESTYVKPVTILGTTDITGSDVAWSKASTDFIITTATGYNYIYFVAQGTLSSATDSYARIQIEEVSVPLKYPPSVIHRSEDYNFKLDMTITNTGTSDFIQVTTPMLLNQTVTIDTDPDFPTAKLNGLIANSIVSVSDIRAAWLALTGGANNTIQFVNSAGDANVTIVTKWRDRLNFF